jgi:hypothetical protein
MLFSIGCDQGWLKFGNHCYLFNHDKQGQASWNDAENTCRFLGSHLAAIRNEAELMFVKSQLEPHAGRADQYMIGVSDSKTERVWKYIDGTPATFLKWCRGEPNGGTRENCGALFTDKDLGLYNDAGCRVKLGRFICKKKEAQ